MASGPDLRVGDAERDATAERLRESYAQGRLTLDEFNERLSAALAATTERELSQLTQDLPHAAAPSPLPQAACAGGWQPSLRLFPFPGKLAVILLVAGLLRGLLRRLFGRGR